METYSDKLECLERTNEQFLPWEEPGEAIDGEHHS